MRKHSAKTNGLKTQNLLTADTMFALFDFPDCTILIPAFLYSSIPNKKSIFYKKLRTIEVSIGVDMRINDYDVVIIIIIIIIISHQSANKVGRW